jgi:hypothetical protein
MSDSDDPWARRFRATLGARARGGVSVRLPFLPDEAWGQRARHDVHGTIAGHRMRGKLTAVDDGFELLLGPSWCRDPRMVAGADVEVVMAPEGPGRGSMGEDVEAALDAAPEARAFFESLPTFYRRNYTRWLDSAKRPETRARRVEAFVGLLQAGRRER